MQTVAAALTFLLAMLLYPDARRAAQAELDGVLGAGPGRLPTLGDRGALPLVTSAVWEAQRWNPVAPLASPHATVREDVYGGWRIPRGTTVLPNVW